MSMMNTNKTKFYDQYHDENRNRKYSSLISDNNFTYFYTQKYVKKVLALLEKQDLEVLDLGCGVGTIDFYLAQKGHTVTGIDISPDAINICNAVKKQFDFKNTQFVQGDVQKTVFKKKFDLIICSEVIEHVEDDAGLLHTISGLLKNEGILLLTTPSLNAPLYRLGVLKDFDRRVGHLRRYEMKGLSTLVQSAGLHVIHTAKTESILRNSLYTFPLLGYLIKGLKGPLVPFFHFFDEIFVRVFGESDLVVIAKMQMRAQ